MPSLLASAAKAACECPHCRRTLRVRLDFADRLALCRSCGQRFRVPSRAELIDFSASELITQGVGDEFRTRDQRSFRTIQAWRPERADDESQVEDPFSALGAR